MNGPHAIRLDLGSRDENRFVAMFMRDLGLEYIKEHDAYFIKGVYAEAKRRVGRRTDFYCP